MNNEQIKAILEVAIFTADAPVSLGKMAKLFGKEERPDNSILKAVLEDLQQDYAERPIQLQQLASGYRFQAKAEYGEKLQTLFEEKPPRYSRALLETLALMAYRQPITRGEIEEIRGVAVSTHIN